MDQQYFTTLTTNHKRGQHLKFEDRCTIKGLHQLGYSLRRIATAINCSPSTVLNELQRGTGARKGSHGRKPEYSPKRGQQHYTLNRLHSCRKYFLTANNPFIRWMLRMMKAKKWSFDACVGFARRHQLFPDDIIPCTKTLYNMLWDHRLPLSPFDLPEALGRKKRKNISRKNRKVLGTSIDERPEIAGLRIECGHWEIDTVIGRRSSDQSVVLTLVEKKTNYYIAIKIPCKTSDAVFYALESLREEYGESYFSTVFQAITADNVSEFERLAEIENWGTRVYFAHPYSSWERPQNERHNRIFRRNVPKGVSIDRFSKEKILSFADEMNDMPRKLLDYATPEELFDEFLDRIYSII